MATPVGITTQALTEAQREAIEGIRIPMAVDAAAGSGKTAVLIRRILTIVGCDPETETPGDWSRLSQILAITFTEKAAAELRAKLRPFIPSHERYRLGTAWIGTFHSFCARLLRRFGPAIDLDPSFTLLDENASSLLLRDTVRDTLLEFLATGDEPTAALIEEIGFSVARATLEELLEARWHATHALAERDGTESWEGTVLSGLTHVFERCREHLGERLRRFNQLDFQELEIRALQLLQDPAMAKRCRQLFTHLLIDEYQDTNDIQTELVLTLFDPECNRLFIVGDEAQSIYRFRGANVSCFERVRAHIEQHRGKTVRLARNFRSRQSIITFVNLAQEVLADGLFSDPTIAKPMQASVPDAANEPSIVALTLPPHEKQTVAALRLREAETIARLIREHVHHGTWHAGDVVLLFRAMTQASLYETALRNFGIACASSGGRGFLERREITDLLAALNVALDPNDAVAATTLLRSPIVGLTDDELVLLAGESGNELLPRIPSDERLQLLADLPQWAEHMRPSEILRRVINESRLERIWRELDPSGAATQNMDRLVTLARDLERQMPTPLRDFGAFLREMRARGAKFSDGIAANEGNPCVRLMTVHAAKGLEFPVVILPDLMRPAPRNTRAWVFSRGDAAGRGRGIAFRKRNPEQPFGKRVATERFERLTTEEALRDEAESKRLLYVAMTRARQTLVLPVHEGIKDSGTWHEWIRCTLERDDAKPLVHAVHPDAIQCRGEQQRVRPSSQRRSAPALVQRPLTLSATQLDSYDICPQQYYLKYVLGLPPSEMTDTERGYLTPDIAGSIVHAALAQATDDNATLRAVTAAEALKLGVELTDQDLQALLTETAKAIALVDRERLHEGERELGFELRFGAHTILGAIDWLRPSTRGLEVVDYKTGLTDPQKAKERSQHYEVQLATYALAAEAMTGNEVTETSLIFPQAEVRVHAAFDEARRSAGKARLLRIVEGIQASDFTVPATPPCEGCIYHRNRMCWEDRARPPRLSPRKR